MYKEFYGFREKPFDVVPDPSFFYLSDKHRTALTYLEYGLMDGIGFILLTGDVGAGKTTIIKRLLGQLGEDVETAVVFNTNVSSEELLKLVLDEFEIGIPEGGKADYLGRLNTFLVEKYGAGKRVLLIVDEAQNLSHEALEEVRMLSNLQSEKSPLLQILLVGQPSLRTRLQDPSLSQLTQRIVVSYHLGPLSEDETGAYVSHRLKVAGGQNPSLFSPGAVARVFHYSGGIPRNINILCDGALVYGFADQLASIDTEVVEQVVRDKAQHGLVSLPGMPVQAERGAEKGSPAAPVASPGPAPAHEAGDPEALLVRLEALEQQIAQLSSTVEWQVLGHEQRAEKSYDTMIEKLEGLLAKERNRADRLLVQYNLLKDRLNLNKIRAAREKQRAEAGGSAGAAKGSRGAGTGKDLKLSWPGRLVHAMRKWFG